jgi:MFS family permease
VTARSASLLATRHGKLLLLLCAVQFLDVVDSSIMNVALPSIRRDLGFSAQSLQWVLSLAGGLAVDAGMLVGARLGEGAGAAMMGAGRAVGSTRRPRVTLKGLTAAYEDIKGAVAEAIKARLAASQL